MTMTDPIADMLTRIRNANSTGHLTVDVPCSKEKMEVARIMKENGFILGYDKIEDGRQGMIKIALRYFEGGEEAFTGLRRVSRPSLRVHVRARDLYPVRGGAGLAIISTSKGIKTDQECKNENLGGEVLCHIW